MGKRTVVEVNGEFVDISGIYDDNIEQLVDDYSLEDGEEVEVFVSKGRAKVSKKVELIFPKSGK